MKENTIKAILQLLLDDAEIKHFTAEKVLFLGDSNTRLQTNTYPTYPQLTNIIPTVKALDKLVEEHGVTGVITSCYRNPTYNRQIGGVTGSQHVEFRAIDFKPTNITSKELFALLKKYRTNGVFSGGLGLYRTFVHIDSRGFNATWSKI